MKESIIQKQILNMLKEKGFMAWKNHLEGVRPRAGGGKGKNPNAGMPDICAIKDGLTWYFEVKTEEGKLNINQIKWHHKAYDYGVVVHVVTSVYDVMEIVG